MNNINDKKIEAIEFSIGTIKLNRNIDIRFSFLWTLCGSLCANVLQDDMNHFMAAMTGIYFINAASYGIKACHQQVKILKLKKEKKNLGENQKYIKRY